MEKSKTLPIKENHPSLMREIIEAFELNWNLYYTMLDFFKKPDHVIQSYADGKHKYVNPIKLILLCGTSYWVITSLLIDWNAIGEIIGEGYTHFLKRILLFVDQTAPIDELDKFTAKFQTFIALFVVLIMQYLGVYAMLIAILNSTLLYKYTRKHGSSFRKIAGFLCYRTSTFILMLILLLPLGYFSYWLPVVLLFLIGLYIEYSRKSKKFSILSYLNVSQDQAKKYQFKATIVIFGFAGIFGILVGFLLGLTLW